MAKSAFLKSSIAKKYWMALTGLFLCLFLVGHLFGNLQLIMGHLMGHSEMANAHQFNAYALFMTTNPAIKALSYLTYASILFHAADGFVLTYQNMKARPIGYAKTNPSANSTWASRNMAILGTIILVFIVTHMKTFWAVMHFDNNMPLEQVSITDGAGMKHDLYITAIDGQLLPVEQVGPNKDEAVKTGKMYYIKDKTDLILVNGDVKIYTAVKDLYKVTIDFFKDPEYGLLYTLLYVISMAVLAFHLTHGFGSAFQSLGLNHPKYSSLISGFGIFFAVAVPLLFAIIPLYIHFFVK